MHFFGPYYGIFYLGEQHPRLRAEMLVPELQKVIVLKSTIVCYNSAQIQKPKTYITMT